MTEKVRFTLTDNDENKWPDLKAARQAFSHSPAVGYGYTGDYLWGKTIVCTPAQFGRFIVRRSEMVSNNRLKQFQAVLFNSKDKSVVDVSSNDGA